MLSGSLPPGAGSDFYARLARAVDSRCRVILDTSGQPLRDGLQAPIFLIKPNLKELGELVGRTIQDDDDIKEVSRSLVDEGNVKIVVASLGEDGAMLTTSEGSRHIRAPRVPIGSKVGAGDSSVAGITLALARGMNVSQAVHFGVAAGSAAVITEGTELCRRADVERLFDEILVSE